MKPLKRAQHGRQTYRGIKIIPNATRIESVMVKALSTTVVLALALVLAQPAPAAQVHDQHWSLLAGRIFPTLVELGGREGLIPKDQRLEDVLRARHARLEACQHQATCLFNAGMWTDPELAAVADYADRALAKPAAKSAEPDDGAKARVVRELRALNEIIKVYGLGGVPINPQIDGPIDQPLTAQFTVTAADAALLGEEGTGDPVAAFDPSIATALALLDVNDRDDAVAFEPLDQAYNGAAAARAATLDWKSYRYTAILVPGKGPDDSAVPLSARGKLRIRLAVERFADGLAPFIIVSGGAVHPRGTTYVEAVEMRKALIERYGIPADRVVLEPYARYTITNLRNATRRLMALGAPLDKDVLVVSDADQIKSIDTPDFKVRNQDRLGYQPEVSEARLSPYELTFRPSALSQRLNPADPLDP